MEKVRQIEILQFYRDNLPHGSRKRIAEMAGVDRTAVSHFLMGRIKCNPAIEKAILIVISEWKNEINNLQRRVGLLQ